MQHPYRASGPLPRLSWWSRLGLRDLGYALAFLGCVGGAATAPGCDKPGVLKPAAAATVSQVNAVACPYWMPLAQTAAAGAVAAAGSGPIAALLAEAVASSFGCDKEQAAVNALLAEVTASPPPAVDAGAGVGVAAAAITASKPGGLVPIVARDGREVLQCPARLAPMLQAAQDRLDARAQ